MLPVPALSYSAIRDYKYCPGRYFLSYVDPTRKMQVRVADETGTLPGHVVHRIVDVAFVTDKDDPRRAVKEVRHDRLTDNKLFYAVFKDFAENPRVKFEKRHEDEHMEWANTERDALDFIRQCRDNLVELLHTHDFIQPFMLSEWWFGRSRAPLVLNDQLKVGGAIDLLTGADPSAPLRLLDYKGSISDYHLDQDQLKLYQLACEAHDYKVGMTGFLLFKVKRKPVYHAFPRAELNDTVERFVQISKGIQREEFPYTPSESACRLCDHRGECPKAVVRLPKGRPANVPLTPSTATAPTWDIPDL